VTEGSVVNQGGHQDAKIMILRNQEDKMTIWEKTKQIFRMHPIMEMPKTTSELLAEDRAKDAVHEIQEAFYKSMHEILEYGKSKNQLDLLKKTVSEFATEMEKYLPDLVSEPEMEMKRSLEQIINTLDTSLTASLSPDGQITIEKAIETIRSQNKEIATPKSEENMNKETEEVARSAAEKELEEIKRSMEEQTELLRTLQAENAEMKKAKEDEEITRSAEKLVGFGKTTEDFVHILRQLDSKGQEILSEILSAAKAQANTDMTTEIGRSSAEDSTVVKASEEIQRLASELCKQDPQLSIEKARVLIRSTNPKLAQDALKGQ